MDLTVNIKLTEIEPTSTYIEEMELLIGYLYAKNSLSELDKRIINTFENWRDGLYDGFSNFKSESDDKPILTIIKGESGYER